MLRQRYTFYLAQSYRDYNNLDKAIKYYKQRVTMGGWDEEIFFSLYQVGLMYLMKNDYKNAVDYLLTAYNYRPTRIEPLYQLVKYHRINKMPKLADLYLFKCLKTTIPKNDCLFVETAVYDHLCKFELAIIGKDIGCEDIGRQVTEGLIHTPNVNGNLKQFMINNMLEYVKPLTFYCPSFDTEEYFISKENKNHNILNPSIVRYKDANGSHNYILNTREVNYYFDIEKNKYEYEGTIDTYNKIIRRNHYLHADHKFLDYMVNGTLTSHLMQENDKSIVTYPHKITGYEDLRLFMYNHKLYAVCTSIKTNEKGINEMCLLHINNDDNIEKVVRLKCPELPERTEKNWTPLVTDDKVLFIYSYQPIVVLEPDLETGQCKILENGINNIDLSSYRGGSQMIKIPDGYISVVHQVAITEKRRYYFHRFVFMNDKLRLTKVSPMFIFSDKPTIEFCAGMCYNDNGELVMTYGVEDKHAFISTVKLDEVMKLSI